VTIGAFDGLHIGHRALIARTLERARECGRACAVVTFEPHPVEVLAPQVNLRYLTSGIERTRLIEAAGADILCVLAFTADTARTLPREFVRPLIDGLRMEDLVIGYDFTLGYKRQGNTQFLQQLGNEWGFGVDVLEPVVMDGEIVSSTRIRKTLGSGAIDAATRLLGHRPTLNGMLDHDLTLHYDARRQTPPDGSYSGFIGTGESESQMSDCMVRFQSGNLSLSPSPAAAGLAGREVVLEFAGRLPDPRGTYEEIEHTADVALHVRAGSLEALLRSAADGMGALMADPASVPLDAVLEVSVSGDDDEALLVNWLNELLYQFEVSGHVFRDFDITLTAEHALRAIARGGPSREHRKHIKAATFNDLRVVRHDGQWDATVVFDI
jgi:SHS2 domain-containing protein